MHHALVFERVALNPDEPLGHAPIRRLHWLATREGKALYAMRKATSEPVLGMIEQALGFRQSLLRGFKAVNDEWRQVSIVWNLRRMQMTRPAG